jgi:hypothetical protein
MSRSGLASAFMILATLLAASARAEDEARPSQARPSIGGVTSPTGAMVFYLAHDREGSCGPNCSEWIAAEGVVEWDTFKRLLAFLQRLGDRKAPVVLDVWGAGDLNVAMTLGKIIRDHQLDVGAGTTVVAECANASEAACFALKRSGSPLDAVIDTSFIPCDIVCVLVLAGGAHRTLPAGARVVIGPTHIRNRLAPNVSDERQQGLQARFGDRYRLYLTQMGVGAEVADIIVGNAETGRSTQLSRDDWLRLGLVTNPTP